MGEVQPQHITMFTTLTGVCPVETWLAALRDRLARARVRVRIDRLSLGNAGDARLVGDGVWELRIDYGPGYRVYYAQSGSDSLLLLCGGDKTTQARDIVLAHTYWADYQQRGRP
jgi:putative addiction module killer protein